MLLQKLVWVADVITRALDLLLACFLIGFTLPLMAIVAVSIKLESPGPIFSRARPRRLGGNDVELLRFRTTLRSAKGGGPIGRGGRLTRIGWFLRYTRIEDLPLLVNVLRGELTLVGTGRLDRPRFWS